ncbi:hypothetical protein WN944_022670 [Citrus x changshan-huyou]|uniref:Uncharacterized protein n=1 Tax=Citrus x changshan-huyou TaxID=2935761 RepID=A0AAP0N1K0_9ROSI
MIEASNISKFDTPCAPERFGKVVSTFTEEQNKENNDVVMPNVGLDNNLYENIVETIVRSVRNELENFKNQIKVEMTENMKLRHMIAMDDIRNPKKVKLESIEGDDDGINQLEIFRYSKVDACQVDVNEEVFQTPQNSFPKWWEYSCVGKVQKGYIKGSLNVLCKYKYSVSRRENCGEQND